MTRAQLISDAQRRALHMEAGTGAQFALEAGIDPADDDGALRQIAETEFIRKTGVCLLEAIEVVADREVLGHVALPGRHRATIRLDPVRHGAVSLLVERRSALRMTGRSPRRPRHSHLD